MPKVSSNDRRAARENAAAKPSAGFNQSKIKDVESAKEAGKAGEAATAAKKSKASKSMYNAAKDEPMINRVEELAPYSMFLAEGIEDPGKLIARYRETGDQFLRKALKCLAYGGWGILPSALHAEQSKVILFNRQKNELLFHNHVLYFDYSKKVYKALPIADIIKVCKNDYKMSDEQVKEFLQNGYILGTVTKDIPSKRGQELFAQGKISQEELDNLPEYRLGRIISSLPDGYPICDYVDNVKKTLTRMLGIKDAEGNNMGYVYKDFKNKYTLTDNDLNNLAYGMNVAVTSDSGKTAVLRYNPFEGQVTPTSWLGQSLKVAQGLEAVADKAVQQEYAPEQGVVDDMPEEIADAPGMEM